MEPPKKVHEKIKLVEVNSHLTCFLCKGYYVDATTISECLHSFCRSCIIKFLQDHSYCPICEVIINKAKPNLKLDKTLQDIVYKLVPELFLKEMRRRQSFYQQHPELAARASPEERGEDTERTIFNPKYNISLSLEFLSHDSTPGAIVIPPTSADDGDAKSTDAAENSLLRFLQCPGMCRVEVLKKFVQIKYTVNTNLYYIDILYKRIPLPDHYTLIDIAYIYSWKRSEPMKLYFRITDVNLLSKRFDYLEPIVDSPKPAEPPKPKPAAVRKRPEREPKKLEKIIGKLNKQVKRTPPPPPPPKPIVPKIEQISEEAKKRLQAAPPSSLYSHNLSAKIEKFKKVSNKHGQPIGFNLTKPVKKIPIKPEPGPDIDVEKSKFLQSIELTAKNASPPKLDEPKKTTKIAEKRKSTSPPKTAEKAKKPKVAKKTAIQPKNISNPAVRQMVNNVHQNVSHLSKIVEQTVTKNSNGNSLLYIFDKLTLPSSLSITLKDAKDDETERKPPLKPVQNSIQILKVNDGEKPESEPKPAEVKPEPPETSRTKFANPPHKVTLKDAFPKLAPRNQVSFQKMFEESLNKSQLENKFQSADDADSDKTLPGNVTVPRVNNQKILLPKTGPNKMAKTLHSANLGMNYTVSVAQNSPKANEVVYSPQRDSAPKRLKSSPSKKVASPKNLTVSTSGTGQNGPLSPNQLLERYHIQNLAQLSATINPLVQQAMMMRHFEMQNQKNWLNMNPGPVVQFEKYMQNLNQGQLLGKEN